jgi:hypothetical protein
LQYYQKTVCSCPIWVYQNSYRRQAASVAISVRQRPGLQVKKRFIVTSLPSTWNADAMALGGWSGGHQPGIPAGQPGLTRASPIMRKAPILAGPRLPGHHHEAPHPWTWLARLVLPNPGGASRRGSWLASKTQRPDWRAGGHGRRSPAAPCRRPSSEMTGSPGPYPRPGRQAPRILAHWLGLSSQCRDAAIWDDCPGCVPYGGQMASQGPFAGLQRWPAARRAGTGEWRPFQEGDAGGLYSATCPALTRHRRFLAPGQNGAANHICHLFIVIIIK